MYAVFFSEGTRGGRTQAAKVRLIAVVVGRRNMKTVK